MYKKIKTLDRRNRILEKLEFFSRAMSLLDSQTAMRGRKYFLIVLDPEEKRISVYGYGEKNYKKAIDEYKKMEEQHVGTAIDQVLVSAGSLKQIKVAYPNYFADIVSSCKRYVLLKMLYR